MNAESKTSELKLLSPRIYAKLLEPNSYLILNFKNLKEELNEYLSKNKVHASIYVENLRTGAFFDINGSEAYPLASLNKLPLAMVILKKVEEGKLSLDKELEIYDKDRESSSGNLHTLPIKKMSIKELIHHMLTNSDNTATITLEREARKEDIDKLEEYINFYSNDIVSEKAPLMITEATPINISNLFISLYLSTALDPKYSEMILSYLVNTSYDIKKYANLSEEVVVVHKHGFQYSEAKKFFHDCGIMYMKDSRFCYCILTKGIDMERSKEVIGTILNKIYSFIILKKKIKSIDI